MSNLIPLEDAARMLGLSVDKLNEMRSNSEIFGYKDGASWKFKMQELERVADEFDITINLNPPKVDVADLVGSDDDFDIKLDDDDLSFELDDSAIDLIDDDDSSDLDIVAEKVDEVVDLEDDDDFTIDLDDDEDDVVELKKDDDEPAVLDLDDEEPLAIDLDDDDDDELVLDLDDGDDDELVLNLDDDDEPVVSLDAEADDLVEMKEDLQDDVGELKEEVAGAHEQLADVVSGADDEDDFELSLDDDDLVGKGVAGVAGVAGAAAGMAGLASLAGGADQADGEDDFELNADSGELLLSGDAADVVEDAVDSSGKAEEALSFGSSDIDLAGEDDDELSLLSEGDLLLDDEPKKGDPSTGKLQADDDASSELMLSEDDLFEDDLQIQDSHEDSIDLSSDFEDSSDMLLDDSDSSASAADDDSGFLVADDSSEIDLSGGLMELADADDADEMIVLDEAADPDAATELGDDDFNLTPLEEVVDEESSGSQVIALEDSEMYSDASEATLLSPSDELESPPMLEDDALDVGDFGGFESGMTPGIGVAAGGVAVMPEQPYTVWQVASLGLVLGLLLLGGMIGYDLARNLWLPEDQVISSGILPMIRGLLGG